MTPQTAAMVVTTTQTRLTGQIHPTAPMETEDTTEMASTMETADTMEMASTTETADTTETASTTETADTTEMEGTMETESITTMGVVQRGLIRATAGEVLIRLLVERSFIPSR